ncbi:MAG TPA: hypothetical protein VH370_24500, partial [Humisphaera sp.]|nr:hypothetical protein [Humisphaera sp.]
GGDSSQSAQTTAPVGGHHHHHHGNGQMAQQIQSAVTSALQSTQGDSSSDPNTVIQDAIEKVLKNAGAGGSSASGQPATSDPATDAANESGGTTPNATSSRQAFGQLLQSFGVDPQQFHNDFLAAIHDAQNGQVNSGTALKSFPPGSVIDETG